jgi:hypothetical protein
MTSWGCFGLRARYPAPSLPGSTGQPIVPRHLLLNEVFVLWKRATMDHPIKSEFWQNILLRHCPARPGNPLYRATCFWMKCSYSLRAIMDHPIKSGDDELEVLWSISLASGPLSWPLLPGSTGQPIVPRHLLPSEAFLPQIPAPLGVLNRPSCSVRARTRSRRGRDAAENFAGLPARGRAV